MIKYDKETFIEKAKIIHGDKYDYSKVNYVNNHTNVCIICPEHGEFLQAPASHLHGHGCPSCSGLKKRNTETFIEKCKEVHGDRYDYSKTIYVNKRTPVTITCKIHGDFIQNANRHIRGQGCPLCGKKYASEYRKNDYKSFISESKKRFGDKFEFPDIENLYENSHSKILIKCSECGNIFEKIACDHLTSESGGCQKCSMHSSFNESELVSFISELIGPENIIIHDRSVLCGREIDIFIPKYKIGFEYNGVYWHTEEFGCDKKYHIEKTEQCLNKGIKLIHIFEDEYINHKEIVLSKIKHFFNLSSGEKIFARKTIVKEINKDLAKCFLDKNHIQGFSSSTTYIGCYYNENLIGVMSFKIENKNGNKWELTRFATDNEKICCGVGGKMFNFFVKKYKPSEVKSFADRRWTTNEKDNLYIKLGFMFDKYTPPDYSYYRQEDGLKRQHKFNFRKKILNKKFGFPLYMTEEEMTKELKCHKIWNCGLIKYVWKNEKV